MLVAMVAAGGVQAASMKCAKPDEVSAIQAAAIQQQLMVAALTCNDVTDFNAFQTGFNKELRDSDNTLQKMFKRLYGGAKGTAEYHAFKTRLANDSSIRSIHDNADYCREAGQVFQAALIEDRPSLADFVSGITVSEESPVDSCELKVAAGAVKPVVPTPNPLRLAALAPAEPNSAVPAPAPMAAPQPAAAPEQAAAPSAQKMAGTTQSSQAGVLPDLAAPAPDAAPPKKEEKSNKGWLSGVF